MKLFNSLTNQIEDFTLTDNSVKIYLCGVTVYDDCHIGHARTIVVFDVLRRYFLSKNFDVEFIQNFTDVDDKIINKAKAEGTTYDLISKKYIKSYFSDFDALNVIRSTYYPKVTEHIDDIIKFIDGLIRKNKAYVGLNGVYYRVKSFRNYGKLSNKKGELLEAGARIEVDESKDDPRDFALWKFHPSEPLWDSPWGSGRPGWHIECSTMAIKFLGHNFDIHGGGQDLIFPHHENEIAQSEGLFDEAFAKTWLHIGMVTIKSEKMSKSIGNTIKISELLEKIDPNVIRLFCLSAHYSKPLDYSEGIIEEIKTRWGQIENAYYELKYRIDNDLQYAQTTQFDYAVFKSECIGYYEEFEGFIEENLNLSNALTSFFKLISKINSIFSIEVADKEKSCFIYELLEKFMFVLGLKIAPDLGKHRDIIQELIKKRDTFRNFKNYEAA
ncbi:MAG TPA: cysteine--tRNA ligase, partial [Candidatus Nitrosocosmicus sp.]|nr:cysteine--tRNA ligase [Candidatus Nitrosocosmicus sp.]